LTDARSTLDWYALAVPSLKERAFAVKLARHGVEAWFPVKHVKKRVRRPQKAIVLVSAPYLPGYVFIGFSDHEKFWKGLFDAEMGTRLVKLDGEPVKIPWDCYRTLPQFKGGQWQDVRVNVGLSSLARKDQGPVPEQYRVPHMPASVKRERPKPGQIMVIVDGPLAGKRVTVVNCNAQMARFIAPFFGSEVIAETPIENMEETSS
jgi:transcription antitermination factor NusG